MIDYLIKVYQESGASREYRVVTDKGTDMARLMAFLMDGGAGLVYEDDHGMMELAKTYTDIVTRNNP